MKRKRKVYSGEFVAGVANEHAGFAYSSVSNCDALDESWSCWSHCCKQQEENLKDNLLTEKKIDRNNEMSVLFLLDEKRESLCVYVCGGTSHDSHSFTTCFLAGSQCTTNY